MKLHPIERTVAYVSASCLDIGQQSRPVGSIPGSGGLVSVRWCKSEERHGRRSEHVVPGDVLRCVEGEGR